MAEERTEERTEEVKADGNGSEATLSLNKGQLRALTTSLITRGRLAAELGQTYAGNRDVYEVLGYDKTLTFEMLEARYKREHIAKRIVNAPAAATWNNPPEIVPKEDGDNKRKGKEFLEIWEKLINRIHLYSKIERADKLAGIGEFGILLIGLRGGGSLEHPVSRKFTADDLMYLSPFSQKAATVETFSQDPTNERFGEPDHYRIQTGKNLENFRSFQVKTHWSRVIHLADGLLENEVYGTPRLEAVFNLFNDLAKVVGGSAEFYWRIADRGLHADITDPEAEFGEEDEKALSTEISNYIHGLDRVLQTRGVTVKSLGAETADPRGPFQNIISLIAGASGIPQRLLMGSEKGQLASSQDKASWNSVIEERQRLYAEPYILRPFVDRLIKWDMLPDIEYEVRWPVVFPQTEEERSIIAVRISSAANNMAKARSQGGKVIADKEFRDKYLGLKDEAEIPELEEAERKQKELDAEMKKQGIVPGMPIPEEEGKEGGEKDAPKPDEDK